MLIKDFAICIRTTDYSETSQIATFFAKINGKIDVIAKGSKRPKSSFGGPLELFSCGDIMFSDSREKLATLTEFVQKNDFSGLTSNQLAMNCSYFAIELINNLITNFDPHPQLFDNLIIFLENLRDSKDDSNRLVLLILFQLSLLNEIGLQPILSYCTNCKTNHESRTTNHNYYFSSSMHGLICPDCEASFPDKIKITVETTEALNNFKLLPQLSEKNLREIEKVLIYHFTETIGRPPKMAKHILKI